MHLASRSAAWNVWDLSSTPPDRVAPRPNNGGAWYRDSGLIGLGTSVWRPREGVPQDGPGRASIGTRQLSVAFR